MDENIIKLLETVPPIVACVIWDVSNQHITASTIELADRVCEADWQKYEIVRCVAAGNPEHPPIEEAKVLVEMMLETFALQPA